MTFVIIGGGIDLSVGALVALASRLGDHAWRPRRTAPHWSMVVHRAARRLGVRPGQRRCSSPTAGSCRSSPRSRCWSRARGLAEHDRRQRRPRSSRSAAFIDFVARRDVLGVPLLVIIFAVVAVVGWVLLNRTTFGRRTFAVGGNPEAARLAGINVRRHTVLPLRAVRPVLRHRRRHARWRCTTHRRSTPRQALRARRHRRRRSSAAPCSAAAAAPSSAPCSAC